LKVKVNKLSSTKTQLPYSYYSIPYCRPQEIVDSAENLGEVLRGDRIENSPYEVNRKFLEIMILVMLYLQLLTQITLCSSECECHGCAISCVV